MGLTTATKRRTVVAVMNEGLLQEFSSNSGLGEVLHPLKRTFTGLTLASAFDLTAIDSTEEIAAGVNGVNNPYRRGLLCAGTLRVTVTGGGTGALGVRQLSDAGDTPTTGIATISNDGKTITFEGTITGFTIEYVPQLAVRLGACAARGTITCVSTANLVDNDRFTLNDGVHAPVVFEYHATGGFVAVAGRVPIDVSAGLTNAQVATATAAAINAVGLGLLILAEIPVVNVFALECMTKGAVGNIAITENVAHANFTVTGMSGGLDSAVAEQVM
jgi:hypothetical protein